MNAYIRKLRRKQQDHFNFNVVDVRIGDSKKSQLFSKLSLKK